MFSASVCFNKDLDEIQNKTKENNVDIEMKDSACTDQVPEAKPEVLSKDKISQTISAKNQTIDVQTVVTPDNTFLNITSLDNQTQQVRNNILLNLVFAYVALFRKWILKI